MARMGDWRANKDEEIELDGIGGVNIIVKADVHRAGMSSSPHRLLTFTLPVSHRVDYVNMSAFANVNKASTSPPTPSKIKPKQKVSQKWPNAQATASSACRITSSGISIRRRSRGIIDLAYLRIFFRQYTLILSPITYWGR